MVVTSAFPSAVWYSLDVVMRRFRVSLAILLLGVLMPGCTMMEWMQPHQLWKLNRQPAMGGDDAYFSIPAQPIPSQSR